MPCPHASHTSGSGTGEVNGDKIQDIRRLRAQYYANYRHYVLPFKVTVPLKKQD